MSNNLLRSMIVVVMASAFLVTVRAQSQGAANNSSASFDPRDFSGVYTGARGAAPAANAAGRGAPAPGATTPAAGTTPAPGGAAGRGPGGAGAAGGGPGAGQTHPPFTPWAQARFDKAIPSLGPRDIPGKENDPVLSCDPDGFPKVFGSPEPFEIVMTPKRMFEFFEKDHIWREIWLDGRPLPKDPDPTWNGTSVGHWEGDTLVVDTIGFNDIDWLDYFGDPHSEQMHLIEKYHKINATDFQLEITVDDPGAYTAPWVFPTRTYRVQPTWELHEWYCTQDDTRSYDDQIRLPSGGVTPPSGK